MKIVLHIFICMLEIYSTVSAQQKFDYALGEHDIYVFSDTSGNGSSSITHIRIDTIRKNGSPLYIGVRAIAYSASVIYAKDSNDVVVLMSSRLWEIFPLNIAQQDTFVRHSYDPNSFQAIDSVVFEINQRFDTTVFGMKVHAYTMRTKYAQDTTIFTVADSFGIVQTSHWDKINKAFNISRLSSAEIRGKKYNRNVKPVRMMSLCADNVYQYYRYRKVHGFPAENIYYTLKIVGDTVIKGRKYFVLNWFNDYKIFLREGNDGIYTYDGKDVLSISDSLDVGSTFNFGSYVRQDTHVVTDTTDHVSNRRIIRYMIGDGYVDYVPPFGFFKQEYSDMSMTTADNYNLVYAKICGQEYGKLVHVELQSVSDFYLGQNYPNPFTSSTKFEVRSTNAMMKHVSIKLYDVLGREVKTLFEGELEEGVNTISFNNDGLRSGQYFIRMTDGSFSKVIKSVLVK